jgi:hypothetical protein
MIRNTVRTPADKLLWFDPSPCVLANLPMRREGVLMAWTILKKTLAHQKQLLVLP